MAAAVVDAIRLAHKDDFRICAFTLQREHVHYICEATDSAALARGVNGLAVRIARLLNRLLGRRGRAWAGTSHVVELTNPTLARNAYVYVFGNARKHLGLRTLIDPFSSARWFNGFAVPPSLPMTPPPVAAPTTWLLREGWLRAGGRLQPHEAPSGCFEDVT